VENIATTECESVTLYNTRTVLSVGSFIPVARILPPLPQ